MDPITRRHTLGLGAGLLAASSLPARATVPMADVPPPRLPIEAGAKLRVLRPAKFVDPDEAVFTANTKKWGEQTGADIRVDYLAWDNMAAQTAVVANTGAGPDIVLGFGPDAQIYADKLVELTDVAEYLGAKYGGWYPLSILFGRAWKGRNWLGIPMGGTTGPANYRRSWCKEAGFDAIPNDLGKFLDLCKGLKRIGHPCGFALSHAPGDAPAYANWLLWAHGGRLVDEDGKLTLDTPETRAALDYAQAMQETMISGTMSWNGASNNQAFAAGSIGLTQNGVSIYYGPWQGFAPRVHTAVPPGAAAL